MKQSHTELLNFAFYIGSMLKSGVCVSCVIMTITATKDVTAYIQI